MNRTTVLVTILLWSTTSVASAGETQVMATAPRLVSVKDFGAKGDGLADDTAAVRAAVANVASGGHLVFPKGTYRISNIPLANLSHVDISGRNAILRLFGAPEHTGSVGFQFIGTCTDVTIHDLTIIGDGVAEHRHAGVWGFSGQTLKGITIKNCTIQSVAVGISLNADLGGSVSVAEISQNRIEDVVGTLPGTGYGIHLSNRSVLPSRIRVIGNTIVRAHRHAIYQARGSGVIITKNVILEHRRGDEKGPVRSAVAIARSSDCVFSFNVIRGANGEAIGVDEDNEGTPPSPTHDITIVENTIENSNGRDLRIGNENARAGNVPERVTVQNNVFVRDVVATAPSVILYSGSDVRFVGNDWRIGKNHDAHPIALAESHQERVLSGILFKQNKLTMLGRISNRPTFVEARGHGCDSDTNIRFDKPLGEQAATTAPLFKSCNRDGGAPLEHR